ncbi:M17 family peptidase N-terminal domain-containing protein, partial [Mycobacterium sp.]|uniref:M17 family peptidase N-terminal domain-containing protein n=1 Tax=Mycobacterium sp. TaxID=1785 RepID=UPI003C70A98F
MSKEPGYQSPSVTVSSSLSKRASGDAVLIVPVVCTDDRVTVVADDPYLLSDAVAAIEAALAALGATGGEGQLHRVVVPTLPVASVLTVGLGAPRVGAPPACGGEWPADKVRRAAGVAARSLDKAQSVVTTLSALDLGAA